MIKISQQEFEQKIQDVIDGKTTRIKLTVELKVDRNTLNNKIQELVVYNPELYKKFIEKYPYRPREYSHIDYEAVVIDILKKGYRRREWNDVYGIDSRTITRRIYTVEETNPDLIKLYRKVSEYRKRQESIPLDLQDKIDSLEEKEIFIGEMYDKKKEELLNEEKQYQEKLIEGKTVGEASQELGKGRISRRIDLLNRIVIEDMTRKEDKDKGTSTGKDKGDR